MTCLQCVDISLYRGRLPCSSSESCAVVDRIIQQVDQLSDLEKLLLYLKLPAGKNNDVDPLKM